MTRVRVDLNISLDGYGTTVDQTPDDIFGQDWGRLTAAYAATRTVRERVFGDSSGDGTAGVDESYAARYFEGIGAEVMGAGMFGIHAHPDDSAWRGWWGDEPPFRVPVFVITSRTRESISFDNGTVFHFRAAPASDVLAEAVAAAGGRDVRVGGGLRTVRSFLAADLVDELHVAIAPILLGQGENLWTDLRGWEQGKTVRSEVAESGTIHVTIERGAVA